MSIQRTEGIILNSFPFRDYDQIFTIFSIDQGILKFVLRGARSQTRGLNSAISPLTCAEFLYREGREELHRCQDISIINLHSSLRENLEHLQSACELLRAIHQSQSPGISAPNLYLLLDYYLKKMPQVIHCSSYVASFYLKILIYEGLWNALHQCTTCNSDLKEHEYRFLGENFCRVHAPPQAIWFSQEEIDQLDFLVTCRSFQELSTYQASAQLKEKILHLFKGLMNQ